MVQEQNFSALDQYWIHLDIYQTSDASQSFNLTVVGDFNDT